MTEVNITAPHSTCPQETHNYVQYEEIQQYKYAKDREMKEWRNKRVEWRVGVGVVPEN